MDGLKKGGQNKRKLIALNGNVGGKKLDIVWPYPLHTPPVELIGVKGPLLVGVPNETVRPKTPKAPDEGGPRPEVKQPKVRKIAFDEDI